MMSKRRVVEELEALAADRKSALRSVDIQRHGSSDLYQSLLRHFGSLQAARAALGLEAPPAPNVKWSPEKVIAELQRLHRRGVRLTTKELARVGARGLTNAAQALFGGLARARRFARVAPPLPTIIERRAWDEEVVISEILERHRAGEPLASSKAPSKLVNAGARFFGSWQAAVETAGLDYDRVRLVRAPYTRDELLALLRTLAAERPDATLQDLWDHRAIEAWNREFGTLEAAAEAAGLHGWPRREIVPRPSRAQVTAELRARYRAGRSMRASDVEREQPHLYISAARLFGTWREAIVRQLPAPARADLRVRWTKRKVLDALSARKRAGKSMNPAHLRRDAPGLYEAAKRELGYNAKIASRDWGAPRLVTHWTKAAVMRALRESHQREEPASSAVTAAAVQLFGSVIAAREAAKLPLLRKDWTDDSVLDAIRALDGAAAPVALVSVAQYRFGSWRAALDAAGVRAKVRERWDPASIATALREYVDRRLALDSTTLRREHQPLYDALRNRWGRARIDEILTGFAATGQLPYLAPPRPRGRPSHRTVDGRP